LEKTFTLVRFISFNKTCEADISPSRGYNEIAEEYLFGHLLVQSRIRVFPWRLLEVIINR